MGLGGREENSRPEEPRYWLPSFKALLKRHLLLEGFLDSSLAPWIERSPREPGLPLFPSDLGWPETRGRMLAGPRTGLGWGVHSLWLALRPLRILAQLCCTELDEPWTRSARHDLAPSSPAVGLRAIGWGSGHKAAFCRWLGLPSPSWAARGWELGVWGSLQESRKPPRHRLRAPACHSQAPCQQRWRPGLQGGQGKGLLSGSQVQRDPEGLPLSPSPTGVAMLPAAAPPRLMSQERRGSGVGAPCCSLSPCCMQATP